MPDAVCIGMKASIYRAMPEYIVGKRIMKIVVLQDDNQKIRTAILGAVLRP